MSEKRVRIIRAEHFKKELPRESERARAQRVFREKLLGLKPTVTEEAVIVTLAEPRERWKGDEKIEWQDLFTKDHLHREVQKFRDLIDAKKSAGYETTIKDAVDAYLLVWGHGRKSEIAAFLWAMKGDYPEFCMKHTPITRVIKIPQLVGPPREELRTVRVPVQIGTVEELVDTVGQALSRLRRERRAATPMIVGEEEEEKGLGEF